MLRPALRGQLEYPEHDVRHHWYFETDYTMLKHSSLLLEHMTTSVCSQVSFSTVIPKLVQMDDYDSEPVRDVMILLSLNQTSDLSWHGIPRYTCLDAGQMSKYRLCICF